MIKGNDIFNNTLSKADIAAVIQGTNDFLTRQQAVDIVNTVAETILNALESGHVVDWHRMFKLKPEWKVAHKGRNPKTGEEIDVAAKWTVSASLSETVKSVVKQLPPPTP